MKKNPNLSDLCIIHELGFERISSKVYQKQVGSKLYKLTDEGNGLYSLTITTSSSTDTYPAQSFVLLWEYLEKEGIK